MTTVISHGDVLCVSCEHWSLKDTTAEHSPRECKQHRENGFARCLVYSQGLRKWTMYGAHFTRQCDKFRQAGGEIVEAREQWLQR